MGSSFLDGGMAASARLSGAGAHTSSGSVGRQEPVGDPVLYRDAPAAGRALGRRIHVRERLDEAVAQAREAAGNKEAFVMGGADLIRQALRAGSVEELAISIAPVVLGAGKRLIEGFDEPVSLEHVKLLQSPFARTSPIASSVDIAVRSRKTTVAMVRGVALGVDDPAGCLRPSSSHTVSRPLS